MRWHDCVCTVSLTNHLIWPVAAAFTAAAPPLHPVANLINVGSLRDYASCTHAYANLQTSTHAHRARTAADTSLGKVLQELHRYCIVKWEPTALVTPPTTSRREES